MTTNSSTDEEIMVYKQPITIEQWEQMNYYLQQMAELHKQ